MARSAKFSALSALVFSLSLFPASTYSLEPRGDLHFPLEARGTNKDGSVPTYKKPTASIEARVNDLLPRMTLEEKVAQIIQGDIGGWMNFSDSLDNTLTYNASGLAQMMSQKAGSIWGGYLAPWSKIVYGITVGQKYLLENTTLGIPAMFQTEGLHGFTDNGTIFPSPIGIAASFNTDLMQNVARKIGDESEALGFSHVFAPVLDLSRELRWGRVEENFGEDPYLTGEMGLAFVDGLQGGKRRNVSSTAIARTAATCKHFAAFGSPQGGLNIAQVSGGERELRTTYLPPFQKACLQALSIMTAYSSYDGIPAIANTHLLTDILRKEWGYKYWVTTDAGSVDLLITTHGTCADRECAARETVENYSGEMGGGTYTFFTLPDQVRAGNISVSYIDETVKTMLRTKFSLGLFENPYPYSDYETFLRTNETKQILHQVDQESIVLLENKNNVLPLSKTIESIAVIGPQADRVSFGDYVFFNASLNGISPLAGLQQHISTFPNPPKINFAHGSDLWSTSADSIPAAVSAAKSSSVAVVFVGTWSLDQTLLWTPGTNATTGEHVDLSDLGLVGAQRELVQAVVGTGVPTVVVFVSGKPLAEPWIKDHASAVIQQFYPGELGGLVIAEILFGDAIPSGKLPVSFPRSVGTTPAFYNYIKGSRPLDPGHVWDNGTLQFGHQYVLDSPIPLWSFGRGLSYTTFNYTDLKLSKSIISTTDSFSVTVTVRNSGKYDAKEVVQVYLTDLVSSVATPNLSLAGFTKLEIPAGSSKTVTVKIANEQLRVWNLKNQWVVEPGQFLVRVGTSEEVFASAVLTVK